LCAACKELGYDITNTGAFDSVTVKTGDATNLIADKARSAGANLRFRLNNHLGVSLDETTSRKDIELLWSFFAKPGQTVPVVSAFEKGVESLIPTDLRRTTPFLAHPVFNTHHSETGMLRYIRMLSDKDLALDRSMIPLGSCTMKLNATSEMIPDHLARVRQHPPVCPSRATARLRRTRQAAARLAVPGHRLRRHQPAAQCRLTR
jgi:glycine dehydrogenase